MTEQDFHIVVIKGQNVWVSPEKMSEFNTRKKLLDGDWTWEQQVELDRLSLRWHKDKEKQEKEEKFKVAMLEAELMVQKRVAEADRQVWQAFAAHNERVQRDMIERDLRKKIIHRYFLMVLLAGAGVANFIPFGYSSSMHTLLAFVLAPFTIMSCFFYMSAVRRSDKQKKTAAQSSAPRPGGFKLPEGTVVAVPNKMENAYDVAKEKWVHTGDEKYLQEMVDEVKE